MEFFIPIAAPVPIPINPTNPPNMMSMIPRTTNGIPMMAKIPVIVRIPPTIKNMKPVADKP